MVSDSMQVTPILVLDLCLAGVAPVDVPTSLTPPIHSYPYTLSSAGVSECLVWLNLVLYVH